MTHTTTDAAEARALKACPFCGGKAKRYTIGNDEPNNAGGDVIVCTRCQASSHVEFGRKENLVSTWNNRATAEAASGAGEREGRRTAAAKALASHHDSSWDDYEWADMPSHVRKLFLEQADLALEAASLPPATDPAMVTVRKAWEALDRELGHQLLAEDGSAYPEHTDMREAIAALAAAPTIPATGEAGAEHASPSLTQDEATQVEANEFWRDLGVFVSNDGVRFSDVVEHFQETGGLEKIATIPATGHAATEGEGA